MDLDSTVISESPMDLDAILGELEVDLPAGADQAAAHTCASKWIYCM